MSRYDELQWAEGADWHRRCYGPVEVGSPPYAECELIRGHDGPHLEKPETDPLRMNRMGRGRDLTDAERRTFLADRQTPIRYGTALIGVEIAAALLDERDRLHDALRALTKAATGVGAAFGGYNETTDQDRAIDALNAATNDARNLLHHPYQEEE